MSAVMKEVENQIVEFDEFETKLIEFKKKYDGVVYDLTIPEQDKQARSDRYSIGKIVSALDSKHKELKAPLKAKVDLIDGRRKEIKDELLEVQSKIKSQIDAHELKIQEHAEMLQGRVDEINEHIMFENFEVPSSAVLINRIKSLDEYVIDDSYEDRKADATLALVEAKKKLEEYLEAALKSEQEAAELEKLRKEKEEREKAEREEAIRKEAAEKATREAEAAADAAIAEAEKREREAVEKAEREKKESELAVKRAEEAAREKVKLEQSRKEAKEKAEREKEEARKAKQAHRSKIQKQSIESITSQIRISKIDATALISAIDEGAIKNISINY